MNAIQSLRFPSFVACIVAGLSQFALGQEAEEVIEIPIRPVAPEKELVILDPAVVDSERANYPGPFSIGHLFDQMAGSDTDGATLMRQWLGYWENTYAVNEHSIEARPSIEEMILGPWKEADGWDENSDKPWVPKLENAPFRLLGIINRLDLGTLAPVYYGSDDTAEGRLVYAVVGPDGKPLGHHFTVIVEYKLKNPRESLVRATVAQQWHALSEHAEFDEAYLADLETITRQFTDRRTDEEGKALPTQFAQIRTNDMALAKTCEMREFTLSKSGDKIEPAPLAGTPRMEYAKKHTPLNQRLRILLQGSSRRALPEKISYRNKQIPLLAGSCNVDPEFYWETNGVGTREIRRNFSRRTCNGCHARDTNTEFCHIRPRLAGEQSKVSDFLKPTYSGFEVEDPGEMFVEITLTPMRDRVEELLKATYPVLDANELDNLVKQSLDE